VRLADLEILRVLVSGSAHYVNRPAGPTLETGFRGAIRYRSALVGAWHAVSPRCRMINQALDKLDVGDLFPVTAREQLSYLEHLSFGPVVAQG
jgi:hypothetical protein